MKPIISIKDLSFFYGQTKVLKNINMDIDTNSITAFIGPSGCGKTTLLRCMNRMNELISDSRLEGDIYFRDKNIYVDTDPVSVRRKIGMVFQKPNPFPKSIYENIAWGARINGYDKKNMDDLVEHSLQKTGLWKEVKNKLKSNALSLSGGQQQRLCIARTIAIEPDVILMDEPTSALDPVSSGRIEALMQDLKKQYTIIVVTHNMQQAGRVSQSTAFLLDGVLVEFGKTEGIFAGPQEKLTEEYISGRFG